MTAFYNEVDPYAAQWLRNLIDAGHIAPGVVDERSIEDIKPDELRGYAQCHFFAGIGVWSAALRRVGWGDDRPVWTGSCPCQPFSAAGKGAGFDDERHLWPAWYHLISQCKPAVVFGEQVANKDALGWYDVVHVDMEAAGYALGAADLCAAGVGAPHIRQRLYFVGHADGDGSGRNTGAVYGAQGSTGRSVRGFAHSAELAGTACQLADSEKHGRHEGWRSVEERTRLGHNGADGVLAHSIGPGLEGCNAGALGHERAALERSGGAGALADDDDRCSVERSLWLRESAFHDADGRGPLGGFWSAAEWVACRDDKWRPVEPGTFPLAHGAPARVGRLRAYGNAIVAPCAAEFIRAYLVSRDA